MCEALLLESNGGFAVRHTIYGLISRLVMLASAVAAPVLFAPKSCAQNFSPYSDFQSMSLADTQNLQIKLTFAGPQKEAVGGVAFTPGTLDLTKFLPFRRPGFSYGLDTSVKPFTASTTEMKAVL